MTDSLSVFYDYKSLLLNNPHLLSSTIKNSMWLSRILVSKLVLPSLIFPYSYVFSYRRNHCPCRSW